VAAGVELGPVDEVVVSLGEAPDRWADVEGEHRDADRHGQAVRGR
jgi:hypothetical protein